MFPDVDRLRRLLNYLSIRPDTTLSSLNKIHKKDKDDELIQELLDRINHVRNTVYRGKDYKQIGLFEFYTGLIMMEFGWFSEAAESFRKAEVQWSFSKEKPHVCLAKFAKGVAFHLSHEVERAAMIYKEVEHQIKIIREEVYKYPQPNVPQVAKYQEFVNDLTAQLQKAQTSIVDNIFDDISPRIDPGLQSESQNRSSR